MKKSEFNLDDNRCKTCNKIYSSKSSLCNHIKKYHIKKSTFINQASTFINQISTKIYKCKYCNKLYNLNQSKWKHEKKCELNIKQKKELELQIKEKEQKELELKEKELELKLKKEEKEILKLQLQLEKSNNITIKQLNNKLEKIKNINSNNTQNIYNNIQLIGFGKEEITDILTINEKKQIMNARYNCLEKLIEIIHCGKYNQFKNIIITNMKDNYIYKYNDVIKKFMITRKSETLSYLLDNRVADIEIIYNELIEKNKIDEKTKNIIERFINKFHNDYEKYTDIEGVEYNTYKHYKINEIKILLYNNQGNISNDISLLLNTY